MERVGVDDGGNVICCEATSRQLLDHPIDEVVQRWTELERKATKKCINVNVPSQARCVANEFLVGRGQHCLYVLSRDCKMPGADFVREMCKQPIGDVRSG